MVNYNNCYVGADGWQAPGGEVAIYFEHHIVAVFQSIEVEGLLSVESKPFSGRTVVYIAQYIAGFIETRCERVAVV